MPSFLQRDGIFVCNYMNLIPLNGIKGLPFFTLEELAKSYSKKSMIV